MSRFSHPLSQRAADIALGIATILLVLACVAVAGCASVVTAQREGDDAGVQPRLEVVEARADSLRLAIGVEQGAGAVLLWVVPGRGVTILRPAADLRWLAPGAHLVAVARPLAFADTLPLVRRGRVRGTHSAIDRGAVQAPSRVTIDEPPLRVPGYLVLVVADAPLATDRLAGALEGITVPLERAAALRAVGKLVRNASGASRWSGVAMGVRD